MHGPKVKCRIWILNKTYVVTINEREDMQKNENGHAQIINITRVPISFYLLYVDV